MMIVMSLFGLSLGWVGAWLWFRPAINRERDRSALAIEQAVAAARSETSTLLERARTSDETLRKQDEWVSELRRQKDALNQQLLTESRSLASAQQEIRRIAGLEAELGVLKTRCDRVLTELSQRNAEKARLEEALNRERQAAIEKVALIDGAKAQLSDTFRSLASQTLASNNRSFLDLAQSRFASLEAKAAGELDGKRQSIEETLKPVKESLEKVDAKIHELEKTRAGAYGELQGQIESMMSTQAVLQRETSRLVSALKTTNVRGRWGEIQLRRVVEMAGMLAHCDFFEQQTRVGEETKFRPDLIVKLPGQKNIIVDAKVPLAAYLEAIDETDEAVYGQKMKHHSVQVRNHVMALSKKDYAQQFESIPEFVILFLPGEVFFSAALQHDPSLIEVGIERGVVIATPTTLIAVLRAVFHGWQQDTIEQNTKAISELGRQLHDRIAKLGEHMDKVGKSLGSAVKSYNDAVGSMETRVFVTARKFRTLHAIPDDQEIKNLVPVDVIPRNLQPKLLEGLEP